MLVDFENLEQSIYRSGSTQCSYIIKVILKALEDDCNLDEAMTRLFEKGHFDPDELRDNYSFPIFDDDVFPGISTWIEKEFTIKQKTQLLVAAAGRIDDLVRI